MPERKGHGGSGHSRFDHMPTEELENILRLDFQLPEGEGLDADTLLYITEVIARREASSSQTSCPNVDVAWRDLLTRYLPEGTTDLLGVTHQQIMPPLPGSRLRQSIGTNAAFAG